MKVLFAVNNDNVSEAIAKKYEREYKDVLSYKNVYYFNAIIRELQKDKTYNRVVISEDLEPFANNNYDMIDKFLLEKYSNISKEAKTLNEERIEVILLCADRRRKSEEMFIKLYNLEIYNAIIGQDRSIDEVCKLIYNPRDKNIAKQYYDVPISDLAGQGDSDDSVSEEEIENIRAHYKRLGKNEDKYVDSFNNIISQYTDTQLKIIIKYLPIQVKAVLEERSPKYQQLVTSGLPGQNVDFDAKASKYKQKTQKKGGFWKSKNNDIADDDDEDENETIIDKEFTTPKITKPIVIPSDMNTENVQKINTPNLARDIFDELPTERIASETPPAPPIQNQENELNMQPEPQIQKQPNMQQATEPVVAPDLNDFATNQAVESETQNRPVPQQIEKPNIEIQNISVPEQITPNVQPQNETIPQATSHVATNFEAISQMPNNQENNTVQEVVGEDLFDDLLNTETEEIEEQAVEPAKRGRGRPRTKPIVEVDPNQPKKGRGRPRTRPIVEVDPNQPKKGRGRPRKVSAETVPGQEELITTPIQEETKPIDQELDLFNVSEEVQPIATEQVQTNNNVVQEVPANNANQTEELDLFNMEETTNKKDDTLVDLFDITSEETNSVQNSIPQQSENVQTDLNNVENAQNYNNTQTQYEVQQTIVERPIPQTEPAQAYQIAEPYKPAEEEIDLFSSSNNDTNTVNLFETENDITTTNRTTSYSSLNTLLTADKKIVAFVGTTKNGTSFVVNNTAEMLASMGISTAILDMTKTKNAYYIYTNNEEELRQVSAKCMKNLENGIPEGLKISKTLTVYTEMPGEEESFNIDKVLSTLVQNYSAVLIDTDFDTPPEIFDRVQEIYLVQSMDVLTIQPLTAFLRNLKSKNILRQEKIRIVINKSERIKSLNVKTLIGGMSCYNAPNMSYMTELFDRENVRYCEIPFETQNYVKYLESLVVCSISLNGYTKTLLASLKELANIVYPLVGKQAYSPMSGNNRKDPFSKQMSNTLDKMKNKGY